jgi:enediyne core biosynthesis thioesterase
MKTFSTHPRITFQDTNVVGNVYFLTFFRWQAECRDKWLREERPDLWDAIKSGGLELGITHWETCFSDPFGATIGDRIEVVLTAPTNESDELSLSTDVFCTRAESRVRIASARMCHSRSRSNTPINTITDDRGYSIVIEVPCRQKISTLDLLSWQGKCRELFLADHAPEVLRQVVDRRLILQTTLASVDNWQSSMLDVEQVRVEMRLVSIKCGQMTVQFEYFAQLQDDSWEHFATGKQVTSSKNSTVEACTLPDELLVALREFTGCQKLLEAIDNIEKYAPRRQSVVGATPVQFTGASS